MPEALTLRTLLGLRVLDAATGAVVRDGLRVSARPVGGGRVVEGYRTASGAVAFGVLPGLRALAVPGPDPAPPDREFWVEVRDLDGRFMAVRTRVSVPRRAGSPPEAAPALADFYLFSSPARPAPPGVGEIRVDLEADGAPAAFAVVEADVDGRTHYGIADEEGRAVVYVPYPAASIALVGSPPSGAAPLTDQRWPVTLRVRYEPDAVALAPPLRGGGPPVPDLATLFAQGLATWGSAPGPDLTAEIRLGEPLVLRSAPPPAGGPLVLTPVP